jgi:glyoxylase-like metal-dependent hydrolase (beta-lactamase superfamily II)
MEGHTQGSVGLIVKEHKVLFNSDAANPTVWMFLEESLPIPDYIKMLERVNQLDFNTFYIGHSNEERPKSEHFKYAKVASNIDMAKSNPYNRKLGDISGYWYEEDGIGIAFNPERL